MFSETLTASMAIFCVLLGLFFSFLHILSSFFSPPIHQHPPRKLPPGPRAIPVLGNLHMLGTLPHRNLQTLAQKYGPIMSIRLGLVPTIVVSSPALAELVLKTHDTVFASRPKTQASEYLNYGTNGIGFTEYGPYWRYVRKVCTLQLLSASRILSFGPLRKQEMNLIVEQVRNAAERHEVVDLTEKVSELVKEVTFKMIVGIDNKIDSVDFRQLVEEGMRLIVTFNLADYVPYLGALDIQGLTRKMKKLSKATDKIIDKKIHEIIQKSSEQQQQQQQQDSNNYNNKPMTFIEVLLSLMNKPMNDHYDQPYTIQMTNIKGVIVDMIAASYETSVAAIEWTLSELMRHPRVIESLRQEIEKVVGTNRMVEESDLPKLTYLDMVVKETLRLHPLAPLLVPRESMEDIVINGYYIPKKTRVFINTWAIGRDPTIWSDNVEDFFPERFDGSDIDFRGHDFQFLPFGSGRRACPGMQLGLVTIRLVVAQLVHCFDWRLPDGILPGDLDMTEKFGLAVRRTKHLLASPTYRLVDNT